MNLASFNCCSENIRVRTIVVAKLKFRDVQRHIFLADFVERADNATLQDRPKSFNGICVNGADDILTLPMADRGMRVFAAKVTIAASIIGAKQTDFVRHGLMHKTFECGDIDVIDDASYDVALTLDGPDDDGLAGTNAATSAVRVAIFPMFVVPLAADESFVNLDHATELLNILDKCGADFVAHEPSGLVGAKAHITFDLQRAHSLFAGKHKVDDAEPLAERLVCVFENGPRDMGEPV